MLRRYITLAIPVLLAAAGGFVYLHFHRAPIALAEPQQLAQAEVVPAPLAPPATPKSAVVPKRQKTIVRPRKTPPGEKPKNIDEVQTPLLKSLLGQLDGLSEGTSEEKDSLRDILYSADLELRDEFGEHMANRIRAANNPKKSFEVKRRKLVPKASPAAPAVAPQQP